MYNILYHSIIIVRNIEILLKYANNLKPLNERNLKFYSPLHTAVLANMPQNVVTLIKKGKVNYYLLQTNIIVHAYLG